MCLVLIIRICLLPLFFSQMRATQRMQVLQPQIQRIQRKYAAREEAHVRREREKSVASRNRRQRKNVQLAKR